MYQEGAGLTDIWHMSRTEIKFNHIKQVSFLLMVILFFVVCLIFFAPPPGTRCGTDPAIFPVISPFVVIGMGSSSIYCSAIIV